MIVLIVPVVAVLNEYEYVTLVALTWLFDTVQLRFVSAAAFAGVAESTNAPHASDGTIKTGSRQCASRLPNLVMSLVLVVLARACRLIS